MKSFLTIFLIFSLIILCVSQGNESTEKKSIIFCGPTETAPEYKGGMSQYIKDIILNLKYPTQDCIQGKVYISFVIDTIGKVTNVEIVRSFNKELDQEAIRVVKLLDNWTPGAQRGKPINVKYTVPINFRFD